MASAGFIYLSSYAVTLCGGICVLHKMQDQNVYHFSRRTLVQDTEQYRTLDIYFFFLLIVVSASVSCSCYMFNLCIQIVHCR